MEKTVLIGLFVGYLLDLILGDPRWLPHPIRFYGRCISFLEKQFNKGKFKKIKGVFFGIILIGGSVGGFYFVENELKSTVLNVLFSSVFVFYGVANRSLLQEGKAVLNALEKSLENGRKRLTWIVGRDTANLNKSEVLKAVYETLSENLSDGVVAPLFYYGLFGVWGIMGYKMVNTLDSMVGYKNQRYQSFGWFSAKLDDVANFIPARITAILMLVVTGKLSLLRRVFKDAKNHTSPNAGYPESALAYILGVQFGGGAFYGGKFVEKPFIGKSKNKIDEKMFKKVLYINHPTTFLWVIMIGLWFFYFE